MMRFLLTELMHLWTMQRPQFIWILWVIYYKVMHNMMFLHFFSEPVKLSGEGKYNLNAIKEIKVTHSYMGLDTEVKGCQNEEPIEECTTRQYIDTVLHQCGCLPLKLTTAQNVKSLIELSKEFVSNLSYFRPRSVLLNKYNVLNM